LKQNKGGVNFPAILFHEGLNCRAYEYFGVHRQGEKYVFRMWAPNAFQVNLILYIDSVSRQFKMNKITESGIWEVYIYTNEHKSENTFACKSLENVCYRYKIIAGLGTFLKNDPFSFSFSNERNCTVINTKFSFSFTDHHFMYHRFKTGDKKSNYPRNFNVLQIDLSEFAKSLGHDRIDYRLIARVLVPYVKRMNFSHVLLKSVNKCTKLSDQRSFSCLLFSPEGYFGAFDDVRYLINKLHRRSVSVIVDLCLPFFANDEYGLSRFSGRHIFDLPIEDPINTKFQGVRRFDLGKPEVVSYLTSAVFYWLEKMHADGVSLAYTDAFYYRDCVFDHDEHKISVKRYRSDNPEGIRFLHNLNTLIKKELPYNYVISERELYLTKGISRNSDQNVGFDFGFFEGWISDFSKALTPGQSQRFSSLFNESYILHALEGDLTQSKESLINKLLYCGDLYAVLRVIKVIQMTLPCKKSHLMGDDFGQLRLKDLDVTSREENEDNFFRHLYSCFISSINKWYRYDGCLFDRTGGFNVIKNQSEDIVAYECFSAEGSRLLVAINMSAESIRNVVLPAKIGSEYYKTVINTNEQRFGGRGGMTLGKCRVRKKTWDFEIEIPPMTAVLLRPEFSLD